MSVSTVLRQGMDALYGVGNLWTLQRFGVTGIDTYKVPWVYLEPAPGGGHSVTLT